MVQYVNAVVDDGLCSSGSGFAFYKSFFDHPMFRGEMSDAPGSCQLT